MINVESSTILEEFMGGSEKNIKALFDVASDESRVSGNPTIIVIDEIDSLFGRPGRNDCSIQANIVAQLQTFMEGVEPPKGEIIVIGITNHPQRLPGALRSRFRYIYVGLPADTDEIHDMLKLRVGNRRSILTDDDYTMLSNKLFDEEASGRDVEKVVKNAVHIVGMKTLDAKFWRKDAQYDLWVPCGEDSSEHRKSFAEMRALYGKDKVRMPSLSVEHFTEAIETYGVKSGSQE